MSKAIPVLPIYYAIEDLIKTLQINLLFSPELSLFNYPIKSLSLHI